VDNRDAQTKGRSSGPLFLGLTRRNAVRFVIALLLLGGAAFELWRRSAAPQIHDVGGFTMGSTWSARVVGPPSLNVVELRAGIEAQLGELDRQLSGYRDTAELSQLNRAPVGEWRPLPEHLRAVIRFGQRLHDDTAGEFDMTVKPLVNLWGFGAAEPRSELPSDAEIVAARERLGSDRLEISEDGARIRRLADVSVDVDAIAPGYAADVIASWLSARGLPDHLVDIGGELRADGHRPDGSEWRVGIERPMIERGNLEEVVVVSNCALATSGDYRAFVEIGGKRYSHTIDPATGRPVDHDLASVTVIASSGLEADGYATTLMVLGPDRGMAWADARGLAVYMILREPNGALSERYNAAFAPLLVAK
jgi:thiamine biosynthesis lipoprotein